MNFDLVLNEKGQPQASNVRHVLSEYAVGGDGRKALQATPTGRAFNGMVSAMTEYNAFIKCEAVKASYGFDVFCHPSVLNNLSLEVV